jgi:hypothetical protein
MGTLTVNNTDTTNLHEGNHFYQAKSDTSAYAPNHVIAKRLTIVALGLLAEPREERLAGEGSVMCRIMVSKTGGDDSHTSHAAV